MFLASRFIQLGHSANHSFLRKGIQLTDEIEFLTASAEVDEDNATAAMKEYSSA
jgi:hypothetical protein